MFFVDAPFQAGTICVLSHELSRYSDFTISLLRLKAPAHTALYWQKGVEIVKGLNNVIRQMTGEWLFILGDDHAFGPDILMSLLEDNLDVVAPVCPQRVFPFSPVVYATENEKGEFLQGPWDQLPIRQVFEVAGVGSAGMLIKKSVLDTLGDPWFVTGQTSADTMGEDLSFCRRARRAGVKVHVDSRLAIGHITPATIWPGYYNEQMAPLLNLNGDEQRWLPITQWLTPGEQKVLPDVNVL